MLLSRVADALYWMSRYLERAEHTARLVDVRLDLGLDRTTGSEDWDFGRLYAALRLPISEAMPTSPAGLLDSVMFDLANPDSVASCVRAAREDARQVREELSSDMWEHVNGLFLRLNDARADGSWSGRPHYLCRLVIDGVHVFQGVTDATMGHGEGWQYLQVGRFIERAGATAALIGLQFGGGPDAETAVSPHAGHVHWVGVLRSCSALEAYCRCYTADLNPERIAEFLLLNAEFPRSVRFAASQLESALRTVALLTGRASGGRADRFAGRLHASLGYGQVDEILADDPRSYLDGIGRQCAQIHLAFHQSYIAYPIESALPA
jgi:uncharacterized alpha-E superfamily protein